MPRALVGRAENALLRLFLAVLLFDDLAEHADAIAGSVVVPDFEIMLIEMSRPSQICTSSASAEEEMLLPVK